MTVAEFIAEKKLQSRIHSACERLLTDATILPRVEAVPIRKSRALRRLGSYVERDGKPREIRLQFAQEEESLVDTFLHELAHCFDHLANQSGKSYRLAHGSGWKAWAEALGIEPVRCGESRQLRSLAESRLKVVAVCERCGFELHRLRRLPRRRRYLHIQCGGRFKVIS